MVASEDDESVVAEKGLGFPDISYSLDVHSAYIFIQLDVIRAI